MAGTEACEAALLAFSKYVLLAFVALARQHFGKNQKLALKSPARAHTRK